MTAPNSAAREGAQIRADARKGLWRWLTAALGISRSARRADAAAARWEYGAAAEADTARLLRPLEASGWHVLHDRRLPGRGRANLDHVLVSPCGTALVVLDTKRWHAQKPTQLVGGRVHCGVEDRHGQVEAVVGYARRAGEAVGVAVWPMLVVHGSPITGGALVAWVAGWEGPVWVVGPGMLVPTLATAVGGRDRRGAAVLAGRVAAVLPPYGG